MAEALSFVEPSEEEEQIHASLLEQLLGSYDGRQPDGELDEWSRPSKPKYSLTERRSDPRREPRLPFFLFKLQASAKKAQVSWWMKKYSRFPPERPTHKIALRVARMVVGAEGHHRLEQAGDGGQPGALSYCMDVTYRGWPRPKEGIAMEGCSAPLREVAVIKRLPNGDGISIMSYVHGLGVKLRDILFVLHTPSASVALGFVEREFYVSSRFTGETLYAKAGLDFLDLTAPVENLIKKLYRMYEQEEQDKEIVHEKLDHHQETQELAHQGDEIALQREQQEKKRDELQSRRAESKMNKQLRKERKEAVHHMNEGPTPKKEQKQHEEYDEDMFYSAILPFPEESD